MSDKKNPYGDDAGTRIGRPSTPQPKTADEQADGASTTGAGQESARGIHAANGQDSKNSQKDPRHTPHDDSRRASQKSGSDEHRGSEPLKDRSQEHVSGYGGQKGEPKKSSDQR